MVHHVTQIYIVLWYLPPDHCLKIPPRQSRTANTFKSRCGPFLCFWLVSQAPPTFLKSLHLSDQASLSVLLIMMVYVSPHIKMEQELTISEDARGSLRCSQNDGLA